MLCLHCNSNNPEGQRFCGECGYSLKDPQVSAETLAAIDLRIQAALDQSLRDQDIIEIKTAQAVVTRVTDWAKLFALVTAVPLALLLATLAVWGVTSFLDFRNKVDSGKAQIEADIKSARADITSTRNDTQSLKNEVIAARAELGALPNDVKTLQSKVARLEEKIGFVSTPGLTPQLKTKLQAALQGFQAYCRSIGFQQKPGEVKLHIEQGLERDKSTAAYYDPSSSEMIVDSQRADDPSFALREYMHRTLYQKVPADSTQAISAEWYAIESGLASYFPGSFQKTPHVAFDDLSQIAQLPSERGDLVLAMRWGVQVWGSAFWELRNTLGQQNCDKLLVRFWRGLNPNEKRPYTAYAVSEFMRIYADSGGTDSARVKAVFSKRGML